MKMENNEQQQQTIVNTNNLPEMQQQLQHQLQQQPQQQQQQILKDETNSRKSKPYVKIIEQPASKALRFRYECEGRSAGSIPGVNSTPECKTYPTIEIVGYKGRAVVVVSCVTKDFPYRPHPHNLVGKDGCKKGVCTMEINSETMRSVFSNLGIQCVKKKDIEAALKAREEIRVDPFKTGFAHRFQPSSIDLNSVRLCFQVFTESEQRGRFTQPLAPVVTEPIYDKKAMSDLVICRLSNCTSSVLGNNQIILLCEKVAKDDIQVRFYEEKHGQVVWEAYGDFQQCDVHKQSAITFKTPRYQSIDVTDTVKVHVQLKRPSDGMTSEPLPFEYVPLDSGRHQFWNSRRNLKRKPDLDIFQEILAINQDTEEVIDLNTPTMEAAPNSDNNFKTIKALTTIDPTVILTNDIQQPSNGTNEVPAEIKNPLAAEIDSIIEEKVREMEQQQEQTDARNEVVELINENILKSSRIEPKDTVLMAEVPQFSATDKINEWMKSNEFHNPEKSIQNASEHVVTDTEDKTLNELLDQVAELDEIYSDRVVKRDNYSSVLLKELNGMETCITTDPNATLDGGRQTSFENDSFDDDATYTSLQIAFKNPLNLPMDKLMSKETLSTNNLLLPEQQNYDPIEIGNVLQLPPRPPAPISKLVSSQIVASGTEEEKVPPLPPKRLRKQDSDAENRSLEANIGDTPDRKQHKQFPPIIIMKTPDQLPLNKRLPPKPEVTACNTLPKQKKPGFFTKLFSRRKSKSDLNRSAEQIAPAVKGSSSIRATNSMQNQNYCLEPFDNTDSNRSSIRSIQSLQPNSVPVSPVSSLKTSITQQQQQQQQQHLGKPVARSVSSVSGKRPTHLNPNVIHIPLKGDSVHSLPQHEDYSQASTLTLSNIIDRKTASALQLADVPICEGNMELVAIADRQSLRNLCEGEFNVHLDPNIDLTEAEHYALYTSIPPQATLSEFDETSAYYASIESGEILTPEQVAERLIAANHAVHLKRKRQRTNDDKSLIIDPHKNQYQQRNIHMNELTECPENMSSWTEASMQFAKRNAKGDSTSQWHPAELHVVKTEPTGISSQPQPQAQSQLLAIQQRHISPHDLTPSPQSSSPNNYQNHRISPSYNMGHQPQQQHQRQQTVAPATTSNARVGEQYLPTNISLLEYNSIANTNAMSYGVINNNNHENCALNQRLPDKFHQNLNVNKTNINSNGALVMPNLLTPLNRNESVGGPLPFHTNWNLPQTSSMAASYNPLEANIGQQSASINRDNDNVDSNNSQSQHEHGLTNLLNIDSAELVRIDSKDQEILHLNTEDLQISNLSISS